MEQLKTWKTDIQKAHTALEKAFTQKTPCGEKRSALAEVMGRFRANSSITRELFQTASGYTQLNPEHPGQAESRFLMPAEEIQKELSEVSALFTQLEQLHTRMAESNLRLVVSLAGKYRECGVPLIDIIQEGNLGLMVAVQRFDVQLGNRFSTYAGWWIKHYILRAISEQSRVVRLPLHMIQAIQNMNRAEQRFIQNEGREPENSELAELLELPVARVSAMRKMAAQSLSLQAPVSPDEDGSALEELIAPEEKSEPWRNFAKKILYDKLYEMLNTLTEREQQLLIMRFGLFGHPVYSFAEISNHFKLTSERCRQIERNILIKLRSPEMLKFFDGSVDF
jgi:RNA polymerase primary sigma factor